MTTMEALQTMIHDQDLHMCLWAEAARTAVYVHNRVSHSALEFKTPEEVFLGKKPKVGHLKIFGCLVFIHIPEDKRAKLDAARKHGLLVGYYEVCKAFRIYIPGFHHIEIKRDVSFDEETTFKRSMECRYKEAYEEEAPKASVPMTSDTLDDLDGHDELEPQEPICMTISHKRKPT